MAYSNPNGADSTPIPPLPAAAWLGTSAGHVQRFVEHLQQAQSQMFQQMSRDTHMASQEASQATRMPDLMGLQMVYVAEEFTRLAQFYMQILSGLFGVQAQWTKELEAGVATLLGTALNDVQQPAPAPAWAAWWAPTGMFQTAQATWTEMTKVMLDAIQHDLQAEEPASPATAGPAAEPAAKPARGRRAPAT
jgi:hypothetical protein